MVKVYLKLTERVSADELRKFVELVKKLGCRWNPVIRAWEFNLVAYNVLSRRISQGKMSVTEVRRILDELSELPCIGVDELRRVLEPIVELGIRVEFKGNYAVFRFTDVGLYRSVIEPVLDEYFAYPVIYWTVDPISGKRVREERLIQLYRVSVENGAVVLSIPRGLVQRVWHLLGYDITTDRLPVYYNVDILRAMYDESRWKRVSYLRDYQREVLQWVLYQLALQGASTIQVATGGGKSVIAVALIDFLFRDWIEKVIRGEERWDIQTFRPIFFITLNTSLLLQFQDFVVKFMGIPREWVGVIKSGAKVIEEIRKPIICCTVQTLFRAIVENDEYVRRLYYERIKKKLPRPDAEKIAEEALREAMRELDSEVAERHEEVKITREDRKLLYQVYKGARLVIIDEVHHLPATTVRIVTMCSPWSLRLGMSATPFRDDEKDLVIYAFAGDLCPRAVTEDELISRGFLVTPYIFMLNLNLPYSSVFEEERQLRGGGVQLWHDVRRTVLYDDSIAYLVGYICKSLPKPVLCLVREIAQGEKYNEVLRRLGLRSEFVHGAVKPEERKVKFEMLKEGKLDVVIGTSIADEGVDLPFLRSLVLTGGGKSKTRAFQRIGRVIRKYVGKDYAVVVDICPSVVYFRDHARVRENMYRTRKSFVVIELGYTLTKLEDVKKIVEDFVRRAREIIFKH